MHDLFPNSPFFGQFIHLTKKSLFADCFSHCTLQHTNAAPAKIIHPCFPPDNFHPPTTQQHVLYQRFTSSEKTTRRTHLILRAKRRNGGQLPGAFLCKALVRYEDNILTLVHDLFTAGFDQ